MKKLQYYSKMVLILSLLILITSSCDQRAGLTNAPIITTPTVDSTEPNNLATSVAFNQKITATFSEAMNSSTITTATFTLMQGTSFVSGTVSYTGKTATFIPSSNLAANTTYTATITTEAKDIESSALGNNFVWSFTTNPAGAVSLPTIISTDPANAATGVALNKQVSANFNMAMDASTFTTATFTLVQGTTAVPGFVSYSGTTVIFIPSSNLMQNMTYTATITTGAKSLTGNSPANNYVWNFTTGLAAVITAPTVISTDPANAATGVVLNKQISANFSTAMDASTITTASFTLMQGASFVSGTVSYSGTKAIFTPLSNLVPNTLYTATITTGAKDLSNNSILNNYTWSFTTVIPSFTVLLTANPSAGGIVTQSGTGTYNSGSSVTVTATPNVGYSFSSWKENGNIVTGANANYTFTISGNRTLEANFTAGQSQYSVSLSANPLPGGTVTQSGNGTYNSGSSVTVTATSNNGYTFSSWKENGNVISGANSNYTFTISGNRTLEANFTAGQSQYSVSLSANPLAGGTLTQSGNGTYNSGSSVTVTATPNNGYTFSSWKENGNIVTGANAIYTFTISGNRTLEANFTSTASGNINLGSASTFGIMATSAITNTGPSVINGDVSLDPGSSMTGFPPGIVNGTIHINDLISAKARADLLVAYNYLKNLPPGTTISAGADLGSLYPLGIPPGTYTSGSTMLVSTPLILDAKGDPNAVWVFQIGSSLTTGASVSLTNGAQQSNVFWVPSLDATIGVGTIFYGTIVSGRDVTAITGATIYGRILAGATTGGTIALQSSTVNVP